MLSNLAVTLATNHDKAILSMAGEQTKFDDLGMLTVIDDELINPIMRLYWEIINQEPKRVGAQIYHAPVDIGNCFIASLGNYSPDFITIESEVINDLLQFGLLQEGMDIGTIAERILITTNHPFVLPIIDKNGYGVRMMLNERLVNIFEQSPIKYQANTIRIGVMVIGFLKIMEYLDAHGTITSERFVSNPFYQLFSHCSWWLEGRFAYKYASEELIQSDVQIRDSVECFLNTPTTKDTIVEYFIENNTI